MKTARILQEGIEHDRVGQSLLACKGVTVVGLIITGSKSYCGGYPCLGYQGGVGFDSGEPRSAESLAKVIVRWIRVER